MKQNLERLSVDPSNPLRIVVERYPDIEIGDHTDDHSLSPEENVAATQELVDAWNALVAETRRES